MPLFDNSWRMEPDRLVAIDDPTIIVPSPGNQVTFADVDKLMDRMKFDRIKTESAGATLAYRDRQDPNRKHFPLIYIGFGFPPRAVHRGMVKLAVDKWEKGPNLDEVIF